MPCRNGSRVIRTACMRAAAEFLTAKPGTSSSRVRNMPQRGSEDVGCGMVTPVSSVVWEAVSEEVPVASEAADDAVVCEEFRGKEEARGF